MTRISKIAIAILIVSSFIGCGANRKHPVDIAATYIVPADQSYQITERSLLTFHDLCKALGPNCPAVLQPIVTNWNRIADLNLKADAVVKKIHAAWLTLSQVNTPENEAELRQQVEVLSKMIADLSAFIPDKVE